MVTVLNLPFLGLGVPPAAPSWGSILRDRRTYVYAALWLTVLPGSAIFLTVLGGNLLGAARVTSSTRSLRGRVGVKE